ncbi:hypothetical protein BSL78_05342 [Apostichopus japonicus]|uniref:HYR domain-containing protein n=1 Tax=Stichopus japonicus TaxID=307972 RepID=A0A2G8LBV9_STIJA|nr:hypothetical protein BSL78_05342 [Apostichopus japonicus]
MMKYNDTAVCKMYLLTACHVSVTLLKDVLPPTIICPEDVTIPTDRGYNYTYTEFKPSSIEDNDGDSPSVSSIPESGSRFYFGNNSVRMIASDKAGNIGTCEFTITVIALPVFFCDNGTRIEDSAVCNTIWDCQNGADELDCDPQIINGSTIEHPWQYNATWLFQGPEELGVHIIFNSSILNGIALNFGEGSVPGRNDYSTGDHLYEVDVHLPSNLIWITVTSSDNVEGSSSLFVETSTFTSPIYIQEGSTLINVTENINCILKVTVPDVKWIEGTFLTDYNYDALLATRSEEGGPLIPLSLSFVPSAFLYPTNTIWILHFRGVLLNISAHDPQVFRLNDDESTELKIESDSDNGCYEQAWVVQLPESSQYAMKVSNNNSSANVVFFEGIYPFAIPLGYFVSDSQSSTGGFVTHVTNTTITVVAFADHLCNFGENIRSFINIKVEMKRENLDVALGQDDIFSMSSAQVCYTDNLLANRRIFSSQKELFVESDRIFSSCALLSLGEPLIVNDELFNNQFVFGPVLSHRSRSSIGVLQTPDPNGRGECPYNIKVHSAVPSGYMVCPGSNTVVKDTQVCDSEWDCTGGEDEFDCGTN